MKGVIHCGAHGGEEGCGSCRRCQALAASRLHEPEEFTALPVVPQHTLGGFSLRVPPSRPGESYRSREIDALLDRLGFGRR